MAKVGETQETREIRGKRRSRELHRGLSRADDVWALHFRDCNELRQQITSIDFSILLDIYYDKLYQDLRGHLRETYDFKKTKESRVGRVLLLHDFWGHASQTRTNDPV